MGVEQRTKIKDSQLIKSLRQRPKIKRALRPRKSPVARKKLYLSRIRRLRSVLASNLSLFRDFWNIVIVWVSWSLVLPDLRMKWLSQSSCLLIPPTPHCLNSKLRLVQSTKQLALRHYSVCTTLSSDRPNEVFLKHFYSYRELA